MEGILNSFAQTLLRPKIKPIAKTAAVNDNADIIKQIQDIKLQIMVAKRGFEMETDFDLIDYYVMQIDSLEKRYSYLIKQAKLKHVAAF